VATSLNDLLELLDAQSEQSLPPSRDGFGDAAESLRRLAPLLTRVAADRLDTERDGDRGRKVRELATACADAAALWHGSSKPGRAGGLIGITVVSGRDDLGDLLVSGAAVV
jgi:hypothetical protein